MSYVTYRKSFYRNGFRPIATNPWAATQLGKTPFDADQWRLGQSRPFTPAGGYGLHGLGDIVPNGASATWVGQISGSLYASVQDVVSKASAALQADGLPVVNTSGLPFSIADTDLMLSSSATVTLQLLVNNGLGYSNPQDIASIVNHEIFVASGVMPTGTITNVSGGQTAGGAAAASAPADLSVGATFSSWMQNPWGLAGLAILGFVVVEEVVDRFL